MYRLKNFLNILEFGKSRQSQKVSSFSVLSAFNYLIYMYIVGAIFF